MSDDLQLSASGRRCSMSDDLQLSASGRRCSMFENMQRPIPDCMDPSCLTAGRPSAFGRRCIMFENVNPSIPCGKEVLHV